MIDYKELVLLNGFHQKIHVKTDDVSKPVLLFLHGGPGVPNRHSVMINDTDLLDSFTLVCWDQRGTAGSYKGCDPKTLTVQQLVDDAKQLVEYLCKTFHKEKIFIIGGSWGSLLGTLLAHQYPEHLGAYVGFGQFVDGPLNEQLSYEFALNEAKKHNDEKAVKQLQLMGYPVDGSYPRPYEDMMIQRNIMMKYGGYSQNAKKRSYFSSMVVPVIKSKEYTASDLNGYIKGYKFVLQNMWKEVSRINLLKETNGKFDIPYYILDGRLDNNTPASLVEDYYEAIEAPDKKLIWFDEAGHNPLGDCPEQFKEKLRELLLNISNNNPGL